MNSVIIVIYAVIVVTFAFFQVASKRKSDNQNNRINKSNHHTKLKKEQEWKKYGDVMHVNHYRKETKHRHYSADPCAYSEHFSWIKGSRNVYDDPWDF